MYVCVLNCFSCVLVYAILWTEASQAPLSMGILQARILEWVAMLSSRGSSQPGDQAHISCASCIPGGFLTTEPPEKPAWGSGEAVNSVLFPCLGGDALGRWPACEGKGWAVLSEGKYGAWSEKGQRKC